MDDTDEYLPLVGGLKKLIEASSKPFVKSMIQKPF